MTEDQQSKPAEFATNLASASKNAQIICIIGGPAVGKGTQCARLAKDLPVIHVSVGDLLRAELQNPDAKHKAIIESRMQEGGLAPNEIVQDILENHLVQNVMQNKTNFLVDGFPRNMEQASAFQDRGWNIKAALHFHSSEKTMHARMLNRAGVENRRDDNVDTHSKRLQDFTENSGPVIEDFKQQGVYSMVDCERELDEVYKELPALIENLFGL